MSEAPAGVSSGVSESVLLRRCRRGDKEAFGILVRQHQERIFNFLLRMTANREEALELAQETFLKAFAAIVHFQERASVSTWLHRIAINTCFSHRRSRKCKAPQLSLQAVASGDGRIGVHDCPDSSADPASMAMREEIYQQIQLAIGKLEPELRATLILRDINGMSYEEIAETMDCPLGTVRSRLHRARSQLREELSELLER
jgi:RNA polymerase sigma-70 factor (ECF subfamily)